MNYNNFASRVSNPRPSGPTTAPIASEVMVSKVTKSAGRRARKAASALGILCALCLIATARAVGADSAPGMLRFVPATGTVPFTGMSPQHFAVESNEAAFGEPALAARMNALSEQVQSLTARAMQQATTNHPAHLSKLTAVLLCAGLGLALFQARWLFRADVVC